MEVTHAPFDAGTFFPPRRRENPTKLCFRRLRSPTWSVVLNLKSGFWRVKSDEKWCIEELKFAGIEDI